MFHPTEMIVYTLLPLALTVIVLGLDPLAASLTGYCLAFASYFQHWNVRRAAASRGTDGATLRAS